MSLLRPRRSARFVRTIKERRDVVDQASLRQTAVIEGPLAFQTLRLAAARAGQSGLQILSLPQLATRLAGGFAHAITAEVLEPAIQLALREGDFSELDRVRELPGITRAVARSL